MRLRLSSSSSSSPAAAAAAAAWALLGFVALTGFVPTSVDAARSWTAVVSSSDRGIADSTKGGPPPGSAPEALEEGNPFVFVAEEEDDATDPPAPLPTAEPIMPTAEPSATDTSTPTLRPSKNPVKATLAPTGEPTIAPAAPTDEPTLKPSDEPTIGDTSAPTHAPSITIWGTVDEETDCSSRKPCGPCKKCDDDDECLFGLECHERDEDDDPVPGCLGDGGRAKRNRHCVVPEGMWGVWKYPTSSPTEVPTVSPTFHPTATPTLSPTSFPTDEPTLNPTTATPTRSPLDDAQFMIGNDRGDAKCGDDHHAKCGRCQGPCDRDKDCHDGLKCMDRGSRKRENDPVQGCAGVPVTRVNYCYLDPEDALDMGGWAAPTPTATPSATPSARPTISFEPTISSQPSHFPTAEPTRMPAKVSDSFKLRLYWGKGYMWQGESKPSTWRANKVGSRNIDITDKGGDSWVEYGGSIRPKGSFDRCWTKDGNDVVLEDCDGDVGNKMQQWVLDVGRTKMKYGGGTSRDELGDLAPFETRRPIEVLEEEEKFEIHPATDRGKCVTNHHQPRNGELLMIQDCIWPRSSDTSFWELD
uniref:Circumsporozoite protein n=1 Tax=Odontella aurita TaxID=265563 RepID=A0A7S4IUG5_9STRA|mmetsp:Transcript_30409/g.90741  ORF Transcript_30409/g.90741 Transcript_30409/m.90741 type:complete len:585 (+) Transcript_30409:412-2166(+)